MNLYIKTKAKVVMKENIFIKQRDCSRLYVLICWWFSAQVVEFRPGEVKKQAERKNYKYLFMNELI